MSDAAPRFAQGVRLERGCKDFAEGISAAVDYRGDVTIRRRNGDLVGYLFDATADRLGVMPADGGDRTAVRKKIPTRLRASGLLTGTPHG